MNPIDFLTIKSPEKMWKVICLGAFIIFLTSLKSFLGINYPDYDTFFKIKYSFNTILIITLFAIGDYGLICINKHVSLCNCNLKHKKKNEDIEHLWDMSMMIAHGSGLIYLSYIFPYDLENFKLAVLFLTGLNFIWLGLKRKYFWKNSCHKDCIPVKMELIQEGMIATENWTILNGTFLVITLFISNDVEMIILGHEFSTLSVWMILLLTRSLADLFWCRNYYGKVLKGKYDDLINN